MQTPNCFKEACLLFQQHLLNQHLLHQHLVNQQLVKQHYVVPRDHVPQDYVSRNHVPRDHQSRYNHNHHLQESMDHSSTDQGRLIRTFISLTSQKWFLSTWFCLQTLPSTYPCHRLRHQHRRWDRTIVQLTTWSLSWKDVREPCFPVLIVGNHSIDHLSWRDTWGLIRVMFSPTISTDTGGLIRTMKLIVCHVLQERNLMSVMSVEKDFLLHLPWILIDESILERNLIR